MKRKLFENEKFPQNQLKNTERSLKVCQKCVFYNKKITIVAQVVSINFESFFFARF